MTHFSWHYVNEGTKTEWLSVQRAGNEACLGSHVPLGHIVVSEMGSQRRRPLFILGSWVSSSSWPWLEGWLQTPVSLGRLSSKGPSGSATSGAAIRSLFTPQLRETLSFQIKCSGPTSPSHMKQRHSGKAAYTRSPEKYWANVVSLLDFIFECLLDAQADFTLPEGTDPGLL